MAQLHTARLSEQPQVCARLDSRETLNSNTINLGAGVIAPALFTSVVVSTDTGRIGLAWLLVMTVLCLACLAREGGARRGTGIALVLMYVGFVAVQLGA